MLYNNTMDFILVFKFLIETFKREDINFTLIGGFALQAAGITRTTRDIDLLVLAEDSEKIKNIMLKHGYGLMYESEDVLNFIGKRLELGRIDFLLAHRKYAIAMLKKAEEKPVLDGKFKIKVLRIEDLIGLKIQSSANDPRRMKQDRVDIEALIRDNYSSLDMDLLKEYFALFEREKELDKIVKEIKNAKQ